MKGKLHTTGSWAETVGVDLAREKYSAQVQDGLNQMRPPKLPWWKIWLVSGREWMRWPGRSDDDPSGGMA